jgi:endonuclease/exonuclease/phosphatase family metal-dependent hydrolase
MNKKFFKVLCLILAISCTLLFSAKCGQYNEDGKIVIMSQNVRYTDDGEGKNIKDRAPRFKQLVEKYQPDIIGTQETTFTWKAYFNSNLTDYDMVGCSREGPYSNSGEWSLILYRADRFELLDSGNFWLSDTPKVPSKVEGSICLRICTWALLKDKNTGKTFVFANTHLDHSNDTIRMAQMDVLLKELGDLLDEYPLFLTGDFNTTPTSSVYSTVNAKLSDASKMAKENKSTIDYTFDNYGTINPGVTIDYCFYNNKKADAFWFTIANEQFGGYVSDHYAIVCDFLLK